MAYIQLFSMVMGAEMEQAIRPVKAMNLVSKFSSTRDGHLKKQSKDHTPYTHYTSVWLYSMPFVNMFVLVLFAYSA